MRGQIVATRYLSERVADFFARSINNWLEKRTKRRQRQHDDFIAWRQVRLADVFRRLACRQIVRHWNQMARSEHQPTRDKDTGDADGNVTDKTNECSLHDRAGQQANDEADQQNDDNAFA